MKKENKYLVVKGTSGLGNRIFVIATAILYCQISKRQLVVDWRDTSYGGSDTFNSFPYFFDCPLNEDLSVLPDTDDIFPEIWIGNVNTMTFGGMRQKLEKEGADVNSISCDISKIDYPHKILFFSSYTHKIDKLKDLFTGDFSRYSKLNTKQILKKIINSNLKINKELKLDFDSFIKNNFSDYNIGVHIRYTDMKIPVDKIFEQVEKQLKKKPKAKIFLATDSLPMMNEFKNKFTNVIVTEKWFSPTGERLHQNWQECEERLKNGVEALRDIYLLSQCQCLIFSAKSSFGYLSSILKDDEKDVYDIEAPSFNEKLIKKIKKIF